MDSKQCFKFNSMYGMCQEFLFLGEQYLLWFHNVMQVAITTVSPIGIDQFDGMNTKELHSVLTDGANCGYCHAGYPTLTPLLKTGCTSKLPNLLIFSFVIQKIDFFHCRKNIISKLYMLLLV